MKIIVTEDDMKPMIKDWWLSAKISGNSLELEDFYLGAHMIKTADVIVFESDLIPIKLILKSKNTG